MSLTFKPLFSGSSGNATYVSDGRTHLMIDAGMGILNMEQALRTCDIRPQDITAILITHEHVDHVRSADALSAKYNIPIYASEGTWLAIENTHVKRAQAKNRVVFSRDQDFYLGGFNVQPFPSPHDAAEPCGFCLVCDGKKVVIATDLGYVGDDFIARVKDADLILIESNYDPDMLKACRYPQSLKRRIAGRLGHLSNNDCANTLCRLAGFGKLRTAILGHLSENSNAPRLAADESTHALINAGVALGKDMRLSVAERRCTTGEPITL